MAVQSSKKAKIVLKIGLRGFLMLLIKILKVTNFKTA